MRDRLQAQERSISAEITGLNAALDQARMSNDESAAYKLLQALKSAKEEHRRQARLAPEGRGPDNTSRKKPGRLDLRSGSA